MNRLVPLLCAALAAGCATTKSQGSGERSGGEGPTDRGTERRETGTTGPARTGATGGTADGVAGPTEVIPQINSKAKLAFEDAVKAWEAQKKAGAYDYVTLERKFKAASEADEQLAEAEYDLGVLAERQGKTQEAVSHYRDALSRRPTLRQAAENLGVIAQNSGDEKKAVEIYTDILTNYPEDAGSRARLGEIYRRKGDNDKAMQLAKEALFRDPKTLQAYKTMMAVHYDNKQYSMARLIALRASRLEANDPEILYILGLINLAEKEPAKARVNFKASAEANKTFLPPRYQLAQMALAQEDYAGAEEHLRAILAANSKNAEAMVNLGVAYKGMGQFDKAMQAYEQAEKLNSALPAITLNKAIIVGLKGEPEKAIAEFKKYIDMKSPPADHPVFALIKEQEAVIQKREDDKKAAEEAKKMEEEAKKMEEAAAAEEKKKAEEELQKQQSEAKGKDAPKDGKAADPKAPKDDKKGTQGTTPGEAPKDAAAKDPKAAPKDDKKAAPAGSTTPPAKKDEKKAEPKKDEKKKGSPDEPSDGL